MQFFFFAPVEMGDRTSKSSFAASAFSIVKSALRVANDQAYVWWQSNLLAHCHPPACGGDDAAVF